MSSVLKSTTLDGLQTVSEANAHAPWRERWKRAKHQRACGFAAMLTGIRVKPDLPCAFRLVRIARKKLDSDNLAGSMKHVRDGIADWLGIDDGDERITWLYAQEKSVGRQRYAVRIEVLSVPQGESERGVANA